MVGMEIVIMLGGIFLWWLGVILSFGRIRGSEINDPHIISNEILCVFSWVSFIIYCINFKKEKNTKFLKFK